MSLTYLRATIVPVGDDQSQHLELSRGMIGSFNHLYGTKFIAPQTRLCKALSIRILN